jgi:hypothetical protein
MQMSIIGEGPAAACGRLADDILVHFDDARAKATLGLLATFGAQNQVLLFTHHESVRDAATELVKGGLASIVELANLPVVAANRARARIEVNRNASRAVPSRASPLPRPSGGFDLPMARRTQGWAKEKSAKIQLSCILEERGAPDPWRHAESARLR